MAIFVILGILFANKIIIFIRNKEKRHGYDGIEVGMKCEQITKNNQEMGEESMEFGLYIYLDINLRNMRIISTRFLLTS